MTEGAQEGLLCVHTTDVCIYCTFCPWSNVAVPTLVYIFTGPEFYHNRHLDECRHTWIRPQFNLPSSIGSVFIGDDSGAGVGVVATLQLPQELRQLPSPYFLTCTFKQCPALCHHPVSLSHLTNS